MTTALTDIAPYDTQRYIEASLSLSWRYMKYVTVSNSTGICLLLESTLDT